MNSEKKGFSLFPSFYFFGGFFRGTSCLSFKCSLVVFPLILHLSGVIRCDKRNCFDNILVMSLFYSYVIIMVFFIYKGKTYILVSNH